jgi:hypothetical protein
VGYQEAHQEPEARFRHSRRKQHRLRFHPLPAVQAMAKKHLSSKPKNAESRNTDNHLDED